MEFSVLIIASCCTEHGQQHWHMQSVETWNGKYWPAYTHNQTLCKLFASSDTHTQTHTQSQTISTSLLLFAKTELVKQDGNLNAAICFTAESLLSSLEA